MQQARATCSPLQARTAATSAMVRQLRSPRTQQRLHQRQLRRHRHSRLPKVQQAPAPASAPQVRWEAHRRRRCLLLPWEQQALRTASEPRQPPRVCRPPCPRPRHPHRRQPQLRRRCRCRLRRRAQLRRRPWTHRHRRRSWLAARTLKPPRRPQRQRPRPLQPPPPPLPWTQRQTCDAPPQSSRGIAARTRSPIAPQAGSYRGR
mmetsp:Transcript_3547/g.12908  ORF Transcript_3547/g.12908 Transcript_3547/m.12908 type:complete len:204 (-) Transcript_3547:1349-1960(-)